MQTKCIFTWRKDMNAPHPRYWFPAKRYGWGWGPPCSWQGWVVLILYLVAMTLVLPFVIIRTGSNNAILFGAGTTALLLYILFKKGEPPSWRWGD
jgi:hypothetical protein